MAIIVKPELNQLFQFVNSVLDLPNRMEVGEGIVSRTTQVESAELPKKFYEDLFPNLKGYKVIIVDTPGIDSTFHGDQETARRVSEWLNPL
jgi:hypothetical protein